MRSIRRRFPRGRVVESLAWTAALSLAVAVLAVPVTAAPAPAGGPAAAAELRCPSGDLVYNVIQDVWPVDAPGGPASAEEALDAFLSVDHAYVAREGFRRVAETPAAVQLVDESHGPRRATALAGVLGDNWVIYSFSACNSYLVDAKERAEQ